MSAVATQRKIWGLVPAGGRGERFGGGTPKQLITIAGRPLLAWTLERLLDAGLAGLTVALPASRLAEAAGILADDDRVRWVAGGEIRQQSVAACLADAPHNVDLVLVHDGARPAVAVEDLRATIEAAAAEGAAVLGRPVTDTLKRIEDERIVTTLDRRKLFCAETPQIFHPAILRRALAQSEVDGFVGTDESSIVERLPGVNIRPVAASHPNPKLTQPQDLPWVERLLQEVTER